MWRVKRTIPGHGAVGRIEEELLGDGTWMAYKPDYQNLIAKRKAGYGYFLDIISLMPLNEGMHQDSVTYNWQKGTGFYNHQEWECKRVQEFYDQLISISSNIESDFQEAYDALKLFCHSTLQNSNKLYIEYL